MRDQPAVSGGRPVGPGRPAVRLQRPRRRRPWWWRPWRWRLVLGLLTAVVVGFAAITLRLFVWPGQGMPRRVDAVVMLNGAGDRLGTTEILGWEHRAPMLVVSRGTPYPHGSCAARIPGVTVICFVPTPATTRGEAEYLGRLAQRYHWHAVAMVTITPQITPGRIWLSRCMSARIYAVSAPLGGWRWPGAVAHEWGAIIRAELLQRTC